MKSQSPYIKSYRRSDWLGLGHLLLPIPIAGPWVCNIMVDPDGLAVFSWKSV